MHIKIPDQLFIYTIEFDNTFKIEEEKLYINMLNEECVEWGVQLLLMGFDHISVTNLAGLTKPYNYNEVKKYYVDVINDLFVGRSFWGKGQAGFGAFGEPTDDLFKVDTK